MDNKELEIFAGHVYTKNSYFRNDGVPLSFLYDIHYCDCNQISRIENGLVYANNIQIDTTEGLLAKYNMYCQKHRMG